MAAVTNLSINVIEQTSTRLRIQQNTQGFSYVIGGLLFFAGILLDSLLHIRPVLTIAGLVLAGFMWWLVASSIELLADYTSDILELKSSGLVGKVLKRQCQLSSVTSVEVEWNQAFKIFGILLTLEHQIPFSITKEFNFQSQVEAEEFCKLLNGFLQVHSD
jgi:hypothetical protein